MAGSEARRSGLIFGLDGGGTSSRLRIADIENRLIFELSGEGINPNAFNPETVFSRVRDLFDQAFSSLGEKIKPGPVVPDDFAAGCVAVAGMDRPQEQAEFNAVLREQIGFLCPVLLVSDPIAALVGGLDSREGMILIAGTGSIAYARLADGTSMRAGGYGHFLGDEGSAFSIGFKALQRSIRSLEGRDIPTALVPDLFARLGISSAQDAIALVYRRFDKSHIARTASLVAEYRDRGDRLAIDIYQGAVRELVSLVVSVAAAAGDRLKCKELLLWGGLFDHDPWLDSAVRAELQSVLPELIIRRPYHDAAYGACLLALETLDS
ncbi:MAG: hypothetical protein A3J97_01475 [Spirochaetes bacterium RIFOXYC1_FULL_54_7]|nr:MAG: hypothetical protein A3J97_01475 [Spirochaetes bacterium RIFOXYC1_FULL_54_7]